jgi:hypothetical protein
MLSDEQIDAVLMKWADENGWTEDERRHLLANSDMRDLARRIESLARADERERCVKVIECLLAGESNAISNTGGMAGDGGAMRGYHRAIAAIRKQPEEQR